MFYRKFCRHLWYITVLDIQFILIIRRQYGCHIMFLGHPGIIFPDIIIDSKKFIFFYAVILYHKCIFRRKILNKQIVLIFFYIHIFISKSINGKIQAIVSICLISTCCLQGIY